MSAVHLLGFIAVTLAACALPGQLQGAASSVPGISGTNPTPSASVALAAATGACGPEHNHCIRPGTWFSVEDLLDGSGHPATPVYEKDGRWVSYEDGEEMSRGMIILRTEVASAAKIKHRTALIVWRPHDGEPSYPVSEEQAQTSSRWLAVVVDTVDPVAGTFTRDGGSPEPLPLAAARVIVERKEVLEKRD
jgi:hypothetical protein